MYYVLLLLLCHKFFFNFWGFWLTFAAQTKPEGFLENAFVPLLGEIR